MSAPRLQRPIRVCFVAPHTYSLFDPTTSFAFGGIEVQSHLLAVELARRPGFEVSFVVLDHGQPRRQFGAIEVIPYCWSSRRATPIQPPIPRTALSPEVSLVPNIVARMTWLANKFKRAREYRTLRPAAKVAIGSINFALRIERTIRPLLALATGEKPLGGVKPLLMASIFRDLGRIYTYADIDADIFISFGASEITAELAATCRQMKRPLLLFGASDADFSSEYRRWSWGRNQWGCRHDRCWFAITAATRLIAQSEIQAELIWRRFGRMSRLIRNPIDLTIQPNPHTPRNDRDYVLWIGKADNVKRPYDLIEIASQLPDIRFKMVVNPNRADVMERCLTDPPANVELIERVSRADVPALMERAAALVNTSAFEGLPNVFLEAFRAGTPVVAVSVDPDGMLTREGCGFFGEGSLDVTRDRLRLLLSDDAAWQTCHLAGLDYVSRHYDLAGRVDELIDEIGLWVSK
jgi:glycosyltransferase involved in cell wall biosynthesis